MSNTAPLPSPIELLLVEDDDNDIRITQRALARSSMLAHIEVVRDGQAALVQVDEGLVRCRRLTNPRLLSALLINRVIVLTELGRAREALRDIDEIRAIPADVIRFILR